MDLENRCKISVSRQPRWVVCTASMYRNRWLSSSGFGRMVNAFHRCPSNIARQPIRKPLYPIRVPRARHSTVATALLYGDTWTGCGCGWILARLEAAYLRARHVCDVVADACLVLPVADLPDHDAADLAGFGDVRSAARATETIGDEHDPDRLSVRDVVGREADQPGGLRAIFDFPDANPLVAFGTAARCRSTGPSRMTMLHYSPR